MFFFCDVTIYCILIINDILGMCFLYIFVFFLGQLPHLASSCYLKTRQCYRSVKKEVSINYSMSVDYVI